MMIFDTRTDDESLLTWTKLSYHHLIAGLKHLKTFVVSLQFRSSFSV